MRDIGALATAFAKKFTNSIGRSIEPLSEDYIRRLDAYGWPDKVRDLPMIERAVNTTLADKLYLDCALPKSIGVTAPGACTPGKSLKTWSGEISSQPSKRVIGKSAAQSAR